MRVFEIVQRDLGDRRHVVLDTPSGEDLTAVLRLGDDVEVEVVTGEDDTTEVSGLLVLAADAAADAGRIARSLGRLAEGGDAVVLIGEAPSALPVGRVVDAFVSSGVQVRGVSPLTPGRWSVAVSVTRTEQLLPLRSYLFGAPEVEIGSRQLLRLVAEHALEGLALRASMGGDGSAEVRDADASVSLRQAAARELDTVRSELATAQAHLDRSRANERQLSQRLAHVERSGSLAVGKAVASMRRHPIGGARALLRVVRGAKTGRAEVKLSAGALDDPPRD